MSTFHSQREGRDQCPTCKLPMLGIGEDNPRTFDGGSASFCNCPEYSAYEKLKAEFDMLGLEQKAAREEKSPKELWTLIHKSWPLPEGENKLHVIEYSAYEKLRQERDELAKRLAEVDPLIPKGMMFNALVGERDEARAEVNRLTYELDKSRESHVGVINRQAALLLNCETALDYFAQDGQDNHVAEVLLERLRKFKMGGEVE